MILQVTTCGSNVMQEIPLIPSSCLKITKSV